MINYFLVGCDMATLNQHIFFMGGIILLNILQVVSHTLFPPNGDFIIPSPTKLRRDIVMLPSVLP